MNKFISQYSLPLFSLCKTSIGYLFDRMDQGFGTDPCLLVGGRGLRVIDQQTLSNIHRITNITLRHAPRVNEQEIGSRYS